MPPMSNDRLWDDSIFTPPGTKRPEPQFASTLVNRLGLARATRGQKEQGIREWLSTNQPSAQLAKSLNDKGFGHLLGDRQG